ncbi:unnamed protein product, partial [Polarella glacialis]
SYSGTPLGAATPASLFPPLPGPPLVGPLIPVPQILAQCFSSGSPPAILPFRTSASCGFFPPCRLGPHIVTPTPADASLGVNQMRGGGGFGLTPGPNRHAVPGGGTAAADLSSYGGTPVVVV